MAEDIKFRELQEDIQEYFEKVDDETFAAVCDAIVFHLSTDNEHVSKLTTQFLDDNGLGEAFINYHNEMTRPQNGWFRHVADIEMIEKIKKAFLALSYLRMRKYVRKPKAQGTPLYRLSKGEKKDLRMVVEDCNRTNTNLLEDSHTTRRMFDKQEADELIAERERLGVLFSKVLKILK